MPASEALIPFLAGRECTEWAIPSRAVADRDRSSIETMGRSFSSALLVRNMRLEETQKTEDQKRSERLSQSCTMWMLHHQASLNNRRYAKGV